MFLPEKIKVGSGLFRSWSRMMETGIASQAVANMRKERVGLSPLRSAFSLVEIMVVLVIIGLLAGVLAVNVRAQMARANVNAAKLELAKIFDQLEMFKQMTGKYPEAQEGLRALLVPMKDTGSSLLAEADLIDPWQNPYEFVVPGRDNEPYEIISLGFDGREGGTGAAQDISHLDLER